MNKKTFSPFKIGNIEIENRIVMVPMVTNYGAQKGNLTHRESAFLKRRAKSKPGLLYFGAFYVEKKGKLFRFQLGLDNDAFIAPLRHLIGEIHKQGVKVGIQLMHGGRAATRSITDMQPVAPSPVQVPWSSYEMPNELPYKEIRQLVRIFAEAAVRAKQAEADLVELHCSHGLLLHQFLSPLTNKRRDGYGGDLKSRLRFILEVVSEIKRQLGQCFPVSCRISCDDMMSEGLRSDDYKEIAVILESNGVDLISVSVGALENYHLAVATNEKDQGYLLDMAGSIKGEVKIPVIGAGRITSPEWVENPLRKKLVDFIGLGRQMIADPDFPCKIREGREDIINTCNACSKECFGNVIRQLPMACLVNPEAGREYLR